MWFFSKQVDDTLLYHAGNCYPLIGSYWYSDRPCWLPLGIYQVTRLEYDPAYIDGKDVYGKMVLPIALAACNGLKVVGLLNNPHCQCDPKFGVEDQHERPFTEQIKEGMAK